MKILFISGHYPPDTKGGGEISTHLIARGLAERGHEVTVVTESKSAKKEAVDGVRVLRRPVLLTAKPLFERRLARAAASVLRAEFSDFSQFDVVHAHDFRSALVLSELISMGGSPLGSSSVVTSRDYAQISGDTNYFVRNRVIPDDPMSVSAALASYRVGEAGFPRNVGRFLQYVLNVKHRAKVFRSFSKQVFISEAQQVEIEKYQKLNSQTRTVIYNPVAPEYLEAASRPGNSKRVLYVGRVEEYKGVGLLLEAWKQLDMEAKLVVIGRGAGRRAYEKFVRDNALAVEFKDHVPYEQMMDEYDKASVVAAPHLWIEPFGRTVVEAMARAKIVVAANVGGPAELIEHRRTGLLFERGSVDDLTAGLKAALQMSAEERQKIGEAASEWVSNNLSIARIAGQYEEFYIK